LRADRGHRRGRRRLDDLPGFQIDHGKQRRTIWYTVAVVRSVIVVALCTVWYTKVAVHRHRCHAEHVRYLALAQSFFGQFGDGFPAFGDR
jgi:hypothetical protein